MRTPAFIVYMCILLLPVYGQWYNDVLSSGRICEDRHDQYDACLNHVPCIILFLECDCVPRVVNDMLHGEPNDGHSVCLIADMIYGLGQPSCCGAQKRDMFRSLPQTLLTNGGVTEGSRVHTERTDGQATTVAKRKSDVLSKTRELEKSVKMLLNSQSLSQDSKPMTSTRTARPQKDDMFIRKLFWFLRNYLSDENVSKLRKTRSYK